MIKILVLSTLFLSHFAAQACSCSKPNSVAELVARRPDVAYIFKGTVQSVAELPSEYGRTQEITFRVDDLIKGAPLRSITMHVGYGGISCNTEKLEFQKDQQYLLSATPITFVKSHSDPQGRNLYFNNYCSLRQRLDGPAAREAQH